MLDKPIFKTSLFPTSGKTGTHRRVLLHVYIMNDILYEILILFKIISTNICDFQIVTNPTNHLKVELFCLTILINFVQ